MSIKGLQQQFLPLRVSMMITWTCLVSAIAMCSYAIPAHNDDFPAVSRWSHPDGSHKPETVIYQPAGPASFYHVTQNDPQDALLTGGDNGRICLMVHTAVWAAANAHVHQLEQDLCAAGFTPVPIIYSGGSAEDVRAELHDLYNQPASLSGALLIGNLPYIVYEMIEDWDGDGPGVPLYADFPCDLFFMDLNGEWSDSRETGCVHACNGKYDTHTGDTGLEIWVGRIRGDNLPALGNEDQLLLSYLDKNHRYRTSQLVSTHAALIYNDDDWACLGPQDAMKLGWLYGESNVTVAADNETTTAADYLDTCRSGLYEFISVRSHGYYGGHGFFRENRSIKDEVHQHDYDAVNPRALFYSLFICSGSDFSVADNLAGTISCNPDDSGLVCWGSTKTGGMFNESAFYDELADRQPIGEAFKIWYNEMHDRYDPDTRELWFYGMALIGDASLTPVTHTPEPQAGLIVFLSVYTAAYRRHRHAHASRV